MCHLFVRLGISVVDRIKRALDFSGPLHDHSWYLCHVLSFNSFSASLTAFFFVCVCACTIPIEEKCPEVLFFLLTVSCEWHLSKGGKKQKRVTFLCSAVLIKSVLLQWKDNTQPGLILLGEENYSEKHFFFLFIPVKRIARSVYKLPKTAFKKGLESLTQTRNRKCHRPAHDKHAQYVAVLRGLEATDIWTQMMEQHM